VIPVAYYDWAAGELLAVSTRLTWPRNLRGGQPVRLCIRGEWHQAKPTIVEDAGGVAALLDEFVTRFGPKATAKLRLGLPVDRAPTPAELVVVAGRAKVGRFQVESIQP
jgi:hypothetical protein